MFPDQEEAFLTGASISLAALYVAALAASEQKDCVEAHTSMQSSMAALHLIPSMLSRLLKQGHWHQVTQNAVRSLCAVHDHAECDAQMQQLMLRCMVAVRDLMDAAGTHHLSVVALRMQEHAARS